MKTLTKVLLILLVSYFVAAANGASFEAFLNIEGIEGDSTARGHEKEINVVSFNIGALNTGTFAIVAGKADFTDLTVFKFIDKASPTLFVTSALGNHIPHATLAVRDSGGDSFTFYKIVLDDVLISSVNDNASTTDQNGNLLEQITLNYRRITWTFFQQDSRGGRGGSISHSFDRGSVRGF